jgi:hypothetical protein
MSIDMEWAQSLGPTYTIKLLAYLDKVYSHLMSGDDDSAVFTASFIRDLLPAFIRDDIPDPANEFATRFNDYEHYGFQILGHYPRGMTPYKLDPVQRGILEQQRAHVIAREVIGEFVRLLMDALDEHGLLLHTFGIQGTAGMGSKSPRPKPPAEPFPSAMPESTPRGGARRRDETPHSDEGVG